MIQAAAAILFKDGKVLIARRKPGFRFAGKWEFPGGKVEPDETPEQCLAREMKEEFDIHIRVEQFFDENTFQYEHGMFQILSYNVTWLSGRLTPKDHDQYAWVNPALLLDFDLLPADVPFAEKLIRALA